VLVAPLRDGRLDIDHLRRVERRRELPTRVTQRLQLLIQDRVVTRVLDATGQLSPPLPLRLIARSPLLRRFLGRVVGLGVRPEQVKTPPMPLGAGF
jgi:hypothetical protein